MSNYEFGWQAKDGLHLFGRGWEPESTKAAVCLVHGVGEHSGRYAHVAEALGEAQLAVLAMDLRGHGLSEGRRGHAPSYETLLDDLDSLLSHCAGRYPGKPLFLYGQSLGGSLAVNYVLRRQPQLAGVIATSPGLRLGFEPPKWQLWLGRLMCQVWPTFSMSRGTSYEAVCRDPAVLEALRNDALHHDVISARLAIDLLQSGEWAIVHASRLTLPLLLMHGRDDRLASPQASQEFAAAAGTLCTLKIWTGLYHELHNAFEKEQVLAYLTQWIADRLQEMQVN